jgi:hypothetical protein
MVKQARKMVAENQFGNIRKVMVEYPQGWLSTLTEKTETKQLGELTLKKVDERCMGDIGTHSTAEYISGLKITQLCADINIVVEGRKLDDDGNVLLK